MTARRTYLYGGQGRKVEPVPAPVPSDKVRCDCNAVVALSRNHKIVAHRTPRGDPCPVRTSYAPPLVLAVLPPVVMPGAARKSDDPRLAEPADYDLSRLDGGSRCRECGCWLPGERALCGMCAAARGR
jgi:hypothetical protein